uniref:Uncharacterized protein n=1 Tax=Panagrolaimus superbus TaxID=310955 RepID=A0A914YEQ4_9BILA
MSAFHDFRVKRQVMAQAFANQDQMTIAQPLQCLQDCTQQRAYNNNDNDRQTITSCIPDIQTYISPMLKNSSLPPEAFESILNQPVVDKCVDQCDKNHDNIVGDLIQALKYFTDFACDGEVDNGDNQCFQQISQQFPNLRQEDIMNASGNTIACKLVGITKEVCPDSDKAADAMAALINILTTFEANLPYTPIDKCT